MNRFLATLAVLALAGCVQPVPQNNQTHFDPAAFQPLLARSSDEREAPILTAPIPPALEATGPAAQRKARPAPPPPVDKLKAIENATTTATKQASPGDFIDAQLEYDYFPGQIYEVILAPRHATVLYLRPGEKIIDDTGISLGESRSWEYLLSYMGEGKNIQPLIVIKPRRPDAHTNMVISTNQRVYHIALESVQGSVYNAAVAWNYPAVEREKILPQIAAKPQAAEPKRSSADVPAPPPVHKMYSAYAIEPASKTPPIWTPKTVLDDGATTWIIFPPNLGRIDSPLVYEITQTGQRRRLNPIPKDNFYVLNVPLNAMELRLGADDDNVVKITRLTPHTASP